jgi:hypothetical protein
MSKETQRSSDRLDRSVAAADAPEQVRRMAPGLERNEALKLANSLPGTADERGWFLPGAAGRANKLAQAHCLRGSAAGHALHKCARRGRDVRL